MTQLLLVTSVLLHRCQRGKAFTGRIPEDPVVTIRRDGSAVKVECVAVARHVGVAEANSIAGIGLNTNRVKINLRLFNVNDAAAGDGCA